MLSVIWLFGIKEPFLRESKPARPEPFKIKYQPCNGTTASKRSPPSAPSNSLFLSWGVGFATTAGLIASSLSLLGTGSW